MRRRVLVLLLTIAVMPSASELIEFGVHAASHGDLAHDVSSQHADAGADADEHGCSPLFHLCGCHAPSLSTPAVVARVLFSPRHSQQVSSLSPRASIDLLPEPPPIRPPIV